MWAGQTALDFGPFIVHEGRAPTINFGKWTTTFGRSKPNGKASGGRLTHTRSRKTLHVRNITFWTCSPTRLGLGCMWATHLDTLHPTSSHATNATRDSTFCIQWGTTVLDCPQNNMPFKPDSIRPSPPNKTSIATENSWNNWVFATTGHVKFERVIPPITAGLNGFLGSSLRAGMTPKPKRHVPFQN